ncbi:MAG: hypothetical protein RQ741_08785 [Wenzhouxiangellaceae bacterium]|nr:hypothetical protein [Wenzhouxiangellaceae bacterium]
MERLIAWSLLALFAVHLAVFVVLGLRRRQWYYLATVLTFSLLCASLGLQLFAPTVGFGDWPLHRLVRHIAWVSAAVSIVWTLLRLVRRHSRHTRG